MMMTGSLVKLRQEEWSSSRHSTSELRDVTCHLRSHSVCYLAPDTSLYTASLNQNPLRFMWQYMYSNTANSRTCSPSLASFSHQITDRSDWSYRLPDIQKSALNRTYGRPTVVSLLPALCFFLDQRASHVPYAKKQLVRKFFWPYGKAQIVLTPVPPPRDSALLSRLRAPSKFPRIFLTGPKVVYQPSYPMLAASIRAALAKY